MNLKQYTLTSALACKDKDIENWIHNFLCGEGNNKPFSDGLKLFDRHYIGPIKMPLNMFERCCGFEEEMKFTISKKGFETNVNNMISAMKNGWDVPPLIINYADGKFELNDGNHRYEALTRCNYKQYYVIIWITEYKDLIKFQDKYSEYLSSVCS